jgi:hypothetical protein
MHLNSWRRKRERRERKRAANIAARLKAKLYYQKQYFILSGQSAFYQHDRLNMRFGNLMILKREILILRKGAPPLYD